MTYPTLSERKHAKVAAMQAALERLAGELTGYARQHGGAFTIFGSAARGDMRFDSDVDILVDFPSDIAWDALAHAESRAFALDLKPDVQLKSLSGPRLLARIAAEGRTLS